MKSIYAQGYECKSLELGRNIASSRDDSGGASVSSI